MLEYIACPLCSSQNYKPLFPNRIKNVVKCEVENRAYWLKMISLPCLPWKLIYHFTCRLEKGHILKVIAGKEVIA